MSDWTGNPGRRRWLWAAVAAAVVLAGGAFVVGRSTAPGETRGSAGSSVDVGSVATAAPYAGPTKPSGPVVGGPNGSTPDEGTGWATPDGGQGHGPAARSAMGVPFGYTQDGEGAALAAVNAVVGGLWLNRSYQDPWQTLGFLAADPTQVQDNTELAALIARGQPSVQDLLGSRFFQVLERPEFDPSGSVIPTSTVSPAAPTGSQPFGAKALGVQVSTSTVGGAPTAQATVLWETVGDAGLGGRSVRTVPVVLSLVWQGDWKIAEYTEDDESPLGFVLSGVPESPALPAESWRL